MTGRLDDLLVLLATDEETARAFAADPETLAERFGLDATEVAALSTVRVDTGASRPMSLEERLSRSGLGFGAALHEAMQSHGDSGGDSGGGSEHHDKGDGEKSHDGDGKHQSEAKHDTQEKHGSGKDADGKQAEANAVRRAVGDLPVLHARFRGDDVELAGRRAGPRDRPAALADGPGRPRRRGRDLSGLVPAGAEARPPPPAAEGVTPGPGRSRCRPPRAAARGRCRAGWG